MDMFEIFPLKFYRSHLGYIDIVHQQNYAQFHIQPPGLPPPGYIFQFYVLYPLMRLSLIFIGAK